MKRQEVLAHWHLESRSEKFPCCVFSCQGSAGKKLPFHIYNRNFRGFFHSKPMFFEVISKFHYYCTISAISISLNRRAIREAFSGFFHAPARAFCNRRFVHAQYLREFHRQSKCGRPDQTPHRSACQAQNEAPFFFCPQKIIFCAYAV